MSHVIFLILAAQISHATELPRRSLLKGGLFAWLGGVTKPAPAAPAPVVAETGAAVARRLRRAQLLSQALGNPVATWTFDDLTGTDVIVQWIRRQPAAAARHAEDLSIVRDYFAQSTETGASEAWSDAKDALARMRSTMEQTVPLPERDSIEYRLVHRAQATEFAEDFADLETNLATRRGIDVSDLTGALRLVLDPEQMIENYFLDDEPSENPSRLDVYDQELFAEVIDRLTEFAPEYAGQARLRLDHVLEEADRLVFEHSGLFPDNSYSPLLRADWRFERELLVDDPEMRRFGINRRAEYAAARLNELAAAHGRFEALGPCELRRVMLAAIDRNSRTLAEAMRDLPRAAERMRAEIKTSPEAPTDVFSALEWSHALTAIVPRAGVSLDVFARLAGMAVVSACDLALAGPTAPAPAAPPAEALLALEHQPEYVLMPLAEPEMHDAAEVHSAASSDR